MTTLHVAAGCHAGAPVSLDIGGPVTLRGPMGSGKTTVAHALALALYGVTMDGRPWPWDAGEVAVEGDGWGYAIRSSSGRVERSMALGGVLTRVSGERIHSAHGALGVSADGVPTPVGLLILSPSLWLRWLADADGQRRMRRTLEVALPGPTTADILGPELGAMSLRDAESRAMSARRAEDAADATRREAQRALASVGDVEDVEPVDVVAVAAAHDHAVRLWQMARERVGLWRDEVASLGLRREDQARAQARLASVPCGGRQMMPVGASPMLGSGTYAIMTSVDCGLCSLLRDAIDGAAVVILGDPPAPPDPGPRPTPPDIMAQATAHAVMVERRRIREDAARRVIAAEVAMAIAGPLARQAERDLQRIRSAPGEALAAKLGALRAHLTDGVDLEASADAVRVAWQGRDVRDCSTGEQVRVGVILRHALRCAIGRPDAWVVADNAQDMGPTWPEGLTRDVIALFTGGSRLEVTDG